MLGKRLPWKASIPIGALIVLSILAAMTLPISAQSDASPNAQSSSNDFEVELTITGAVQSFTATSLTLSGGVVIVIPSGVTLPPGVMQGTTVTVTVVVNDDQFVAITIVIGNATVTPTEQATETEEPTEPEETETAEPTQPVTVTPTAQPTGSATVPPTAVATVTCGSGNIQPVAQRLAMFFHVSYQEIMSWHCMGFGFGEMAKAYALAMATAGTPNAPTAAAIFALRQSGLGWGQIMQMFKVSPHQLAPGIAIRQGKGNGNGKPTAEATSDKHGHGDGNGNGNGNGNGHGHDK